MNLRICILCVRTLGTSAWLLLLPPIAAAPIASVTILRSSPNPAVEGLPVTFIAGANFTVGQAPTGTITLTDTFQGIPAVLGTIALDPATGAGTFITSTLPIGPHNVVASYGGDPNYAPSTSQGLQ
jgi:hypothetical protein